MTTQELLPSNPFRADAYLDRSQAGQARLMGEVTFDKVIEAFRHYISRELDARDGKEDIDTEYLARKHRAIIGEKADKQYFIQKVHDFIREFPQYQNTRYPEYYPSLTEAIFQHHLGFGPMSVWFANPTESATVNGTQILFGTHGSSTKQLQPFEFDSIDQVKRLIRTLTLKDADTQVNQTHNWTQVDMVDGTRVTIFTPPLSETYVIVFRQYLFNEFTFESVAKHRTIPGDSVQWWKLLSRLMLTMMTTGIRRSGKTTLLKVIYGARDPDLEVVTVERGTFEAHLKRDFPKRSSRIHSLKSTLEDMNSLFPAFLRSDAHYMMVPEIRSMEVDLLILSRERGNGCLASYHSPYVLNIPLELADLSLEVRPNRDHRATYVRTAQSLDVAITMWEDPTGRKIVTGVYAYEFDHESSSFTVTTWMKYDRQTDAWAFHAEIPPQLKQRLEDTYPDVLVPFLTEFQRLAQAHPLSGQAVRTVRV
ncbi:ATPase, T2SS/T4P/T4SS family [Alicyclobacillus sp. ALC3]|uniref:ATPase, T2SS/T4P/T4SS family n=1 Tax=Alicyclobacillus sp. ALC3 TaxID=2796143 RepID=UPI0023783FF0|nr:ATPase, T2SS/T4P/T4SS family [Alicyclobacillus sp. ALC3]WDL99808.1 Flp pilus assembly complex ATPase component TadA [Alicyclobacillus sp. ALC3]